MNSFEQDRNRASVRPTVPLSISVTPHVGNPMSADAHPASDDGHGETSPTQLGIQVRVLGSLVVSSAWQVKELELRDQAPGSRRAETACPSARSHVEIDLSGVTELDAAGIAAVVFLARSAQADGFRVHVVEPSHEQARGVAAMTGMFDLLNRRPVVAA